MVRDNYKRIPQSQPSQVRIDRTKMMRSSYVKSFRGSSDIERLIEEMNPELEKEKLKEMQIRDLLEELSEF